MVNASMVVTIQSGSPLSGIQRTFRCEQLSSPPQYPSPEPETVLCSLQPMDITINVKVKRLSHQYILIFIRLMA